MILNPEIEVHRHLGATVLTVEGDVDLPRTPALRGVLADIVQRHDGPLVVDLSEATFIDSSGLASLMNALRRLTRAGRQMALVIASDAIRRPFELTRLDGSFRIFATREEALYSISPSR